MIGLSFVMSTSRVAASQNFMLLFHKWQSFRNQQGSDCRNRIFEAPGVELSLLLLRVIDLMMP